MNNNEYTFTLKYELPPNLVDTDALVDELYSECCDDAIIGVGVPGHIALEFVREAQNVSIAIQSAHEEIFTYYLTKQIP